MGPLWKVALLVVLVFGSFGFGTAARHVARDLWSQITSTPMAVETKNEGRKQDQLFPPPRQTRLRRAVTRRKRKSRPKRNK